MNKECICLNGIVYNSDNLDVLSALSEEKWLSEICNFLSEWFSDATEILTHTSGSTGKPKEIRLRKDVMRNSARMTNEFFSMTQSMTALLCLPASYIAGKMMVVRAIVGGYNLIAIPPSANPFQNMHIAIDFAAITPYQLHHSVESLRSSSVRNIIVGGGQVTAEMEARCSELNIRMYETYGMTETASHIALRAFAGENRSDAFQALKGVTLRQDERGCLVVIAPHLHANDITTNDIVDLKDVRHFKWLGRFDSVINSGSVKIYPEQVERKLAPLFVSRFFIGSIPDKILGNKVVVVVEADGMPQAKLAELTCSMTNLVDKYEMPKEICFVPEFICSDSNKILRNETLKNITARNTTEL